jgi:hypothetical protein
VAACTILKIFRQSFLNLLADALFYHSDFLWSNIVSGQYSSRLIVLFPANNAAFESIRLSLPKAIANAGSWRNLSWSLTSSYPNTMP